MTILLLFSQICLLGQVQGIDILNGKKKTTFNFEYRNGLIIVPVWYENFIKLNFIFDTGAQHIILFEKALSDLMGNTYDQKINLMGSDMSDSLYAYITRNISLRLPNEVQVKRDLVVLENDRLRLDEILGFNIDGILGAGLFNNLIVQVDFKKKKIHFHHPDYFSGIKLDDYHELDLIIKNHKPYVQADITQAGVLSYQRFLIDTGASLGLLLHHGEGAEVELPDKVIPGSLGAGLGGSIEGYAGKIELLKIDSFKFENLLSHFQSIDSSVISRDRIYRDGILGNAILSRFSFYIDYVRNKLYLKPYKKYNEEFDYDRSGLLLYAFGKNLNQFYVKRVLQGSPADIAGIQKGDVIKKVGCWSTRFYSLEKITKKLSGKIGDKIRLTLDRNGKKLKVSFKLVDLLAN